jgi:DNA modification methylase
MILHLVPLTAIVIGENRQRREFKPERLTELANDICSNGLIHPLAVRANGADDSVRLVAGERRLRAIQQLIEQQRTFSCNGALIPPGMVPCTHLGEMTELEAREAELSENIIRLDLTWQERAKAEADLHALRQERNPAQTITATASEILGAPAAGSQIAGVSQSIVLSKYLDDPDIAKAKSKDEAMKVLRKKAEAGKRAELAFAFDRASSPHTFELCSCYDYINGITHGSVDVIITDPPYGIDADAFGSQAQATHTYADDEEAFFRAVRMLSTQGMIITKPAAHLYMFCDYRHFERAKLELALAGWWVWPRPLIWDKGNGMLPYPELGPRNCYETILYAVKGKRPVIYQGQSDVLRIPGVARPEQGAQKPAQLYLELLHRSCSPGDTVFDPFTGTGPVFAAANSLSLVAIGCEIDAERYNFALSRINEKVNSLEAL